MRLLPRRSGIARLVFNIVATLQVTWFYLSRVPTAFSLEVYEQGRAPVPFQHRLLLQPVLAWAHSNAALVQTAGWLTHQHAWFPHGVRPESLVQLPLNLVAVVLTGCIAEAMYARASRTRVLRGLVYPLTLAMVAIVFDLYTVHSLRFVYDLPAMAFSATGLYLLYTQRPLWQFALLFACATLNRETTLLLLAALLLQQWSRNRVVVAACLLAVWAAWQVWVTHRFATNVSAAGPRMLLNLGTLLCPFSWPQLGTFLALCVLPLRYGLGSNADAVLSRWRLLVPIWFVFMLRYGLLIETRVFGELIPLLSVLLALVMDQILSRRFAQCVTTRAADVLIAI